MQAWKARFYFYLVGAKSVKNEEENKQKRSLTPIPLQGEMRIVEPLPQPLSEERGE